MTVLLQLPFYDIVLLCYCYAIHVYVISIVKVLSKTMSEALRQRGPEMEATAVFVELVDKFFDRLNVGNYTDGKRSRNPFKQPYRGKGDFRFEV